MVIQNEKLPREGNFPVTNKTIHAFPFIPIGSASNGPKYILAKMMATNTIYCNTTYDI